MGKIKNININPLKNLVATPFRFFSVLWQRGLDVVHALWDTIKDEFSIIKNTKNWIQNTFKQAGARKWIFNKMAGIVEWSVDSLLWIVDWAWRLIFSPLQNIPTHIWESLEATRKDISDILQQSVSMTQSSFSPTPATRIRDIKYKNRIAKDSYFNDQLNKTNLENDINPQKEAKAQKKQTKKSQREELKVQKKQAKQNEKVQKKQEKQELKNQKNQKKQELKNQKKQAKQNEKVQKKQAKQNEKVQKKQKKQELKNQKKQAKTQRKQEQKRQKKENRSKKRQTNKQNRQKNREEKKQQRKIAREERIKQREAEMNED